MILTKAVLSQLRDSIIQRLPGGEALLVLVLASFYGTLDKGEALLLLQGDL